MIQFYGDAAPTTTAQMHKVAVRNGKPVFYDPPAVKGNEGQTTGRASPHRPAEPFKARSGWW